MNGGESFSDDFPISSNLKELRHPVSPVVVKRLADLEDMELGDSRLRPTLRRVEGPDGSAIVEPRVMQVLVALALARGAVLSRETLLQLCWDGVTVGEDSLTRAIGEARRALREAGSKVVRIETIPKTGYRLAGGDGDALQAAAEQPGPAERLPSTAGEPGLSRRWVLGIGAGALAVCAGGAGLWQLTRPSMAEERAEELLLGAEPDAETKARALLEHRVAEAPDDAQALGLLAVAFQRIAARRGPALLADAERECRAAAQAALALDRVEGNAMAALALLEPMLGAWSAVGERLRQAVALAPDNPFAGVGFVSFLLSTGRGRAARALAAALVESRPQAAQVVSTAAMAAWQAEGAAAALEELKRAGPAGEAPALEVQQAWLLGEAGRTVEARALIDQIRGRQSAPSRILDAVALTFEGGPETGPALAAWDRAAKVQAGSLALLGYARLGDLDRLFAHADRWFGGPFEPDVPPAEARALRHMRWTSFLFLPALSAARADPRFMALCKRIGLAAFWGTDPIRPDFLARDYLPA